jgi:hypothetical protein
MPLPVGGERHVFLKGYRRQAADFRNIEEEDSKDAWLAVSSGFPEV